MNEIYLADIRPAAVDLAERCMMRSPPYLMRRIIFNFYWVG